MHRKLASAERALASSIATQQLNDAPSDFPAAFPAEPASAAAPAASRPGQPE